MRTQKNLNLYHKLLTLLLLPPTFIPVSLYLLLQTNWQEQSHSIKLVDAAKQIIMLLQHRLAHSLAGNLRVIVNSVLEQMEVGSTFKSEQVRDQIDGYTTAACNTNTTTAVHNTFITETTINTVNNNKLLSANTAP